MDTESGIHCSIASIGDTYYFEVGFDFTLLMRIVGPGVSMHAS